MTATRDCRVCGGEGWLDKAPTGNNATGNNDCNYCDGTGMESCPDRLSSKNEDRVFTFLNELRESGETNMFGAHPYRGYGAHSLHRLVDHFGFNEREAKAWVSRWRKMVYA